MLRYYCMYLSKAMFPSEGSGEPLGYLKISKGKRQRQAKMKKKTFICGSVNPWGFLIAAQDPVPLLDQGCCRFKRVSALYFTGEGFTVGSVANIERLSTP